MEEKAVNIMLRAMKDWSESEKKRKELTEMQRVELWLVKELLSGVKLEALSEDERRVALEIFDIFQSLVPIRELRERERKELEELCGEK